MLLVNLFQVVKRTIIPLTTLFTLRATSLAATVAQNGYVDPNVALAQQLVNGLVGTPIVDAP